MLNEGKVSLHDMDLFHVTDSPQEAVNIVTHALNSLHGGRYRPDDIRG
jgi:predicted Rossmann-fold nucleotide-binding protein